MRLTASTGISVASAFCIGLGNAAAVIPVKGVNLGGWLVTEPWMTPGLFTSTNTSDEWSLCNALGKEKCLSTLDDHWSTFYTRSDIWQIKNAGLNMIRIPLGYWAVAELEDFEPYVSGQYPYLVRAVNWAQELDLSVTIDIHGAPGGINGWEESGLVGPIEFPANQTNSDRTLTVLRNLTQEFSQAKYGGAVTNIELLNEPIFALAELKDFYTAGAKVVGTSTGDGINVTIHDAFYNPHSWTNYDPADAEATKPAEHLTVDTHQFWAFPPLDTLPKPDLLQAICDFGANQKEPNNGIPPTLVGEWSLSTGITANSSTQVQDDRDKRTWFRTLFEAQSAAFSPNGPNQAAIGWMFWSWKTQYDIDAWSYRKGLQYGYIPSNVSDPSTFAFPLLNDTGCIDTTHSYTAAAIVSSTTTATSTATSTATRTGGSNGATTTNAQGSATAASAAWAISPAWSILAAFASVTLFSISC